MVGQWVKAAGVDGLHAQTGCGQRERGSTAYGRRPSHNPA